MKQRVTTVLIGISALAQFAPFVMLLAFAVAATAQTEKTEDTVEQLFVTPASTLDPALPEIPFGDWVGAQIPKRSGRIFEITQCSGAHAGTAPSTCLTIDVHIVSRHRTLHLEFDSNSLAFRGGAMAAEELEGDFPIEALSALPNLLRRGMRPFPLTCPENTNLKLRESYAGLFEWCEDTEGTQQGPARAWFSTGIYLLHRGQYADGRKVGDWTECDRFERCAFNSYENGTKQ
ncbi:MAG: hypothetical protein GKS02_11610 [Alphaproteobacteria bacterium]|nr:hypothetical protein [Alphaproteobacteria bacterium]